jgi:hypothetical protein
MAESKGTSKTDRPVNILFHAPQAKPPPELEPVAPAVEVEAKATPLPSSSVVKPERKPDRKPVKAKLRMMTWVMIPNRSSVEFGKVVRHHCGQFALKKTCMKVSALRSNLLQKLWDLE